MKLTATLETPQGANYYFHDGGTRYAEAWVIRVGGCIHNGEILLSDDATGKNFRMGSSNPKPSPEYIQSLFEKHFEGTN